VQCPGRRQSAVRSRAAGRVSGMREVVRHNLPHPGHTTRRPTPNSRPPATKAPHTIRGDNTSTVSSSRWWPYECPKHPEQTITAIKHPAASSWFSCLRLYYDAQTNIHKIYFLSVAESINTKNNHNDSSINNMDNTMPVLCLLQSFKNPFPNNEFKLLSAT